MNFLSEEKQNELKKLINTKPIHDLFFRFFFEFLIDGKLLFCEQLLKLILPPVVYNAFDWNTLSLFNVQSNFDYRGIERFPDLVVSAQPKDKDYLTDFVLLLEHKSDYDADTLQQLAQYQVLLYEQTKNPIVPIVVYHGKKLNWSGPVRFKERLNSPPEILRPYYDDSVMDFKCQLLNVHDVMREGRAKGMEILPALFALADTWKIGLDSVETAFKLSIDLDPEIQKFVTQFVLWYMRVRNEHITQNDIIEIENRIMPEDRKMLLSLFGDVEEESLARGREEGRVEGREEGRVEGREEVAANMICRGFETDDICRATDLDRDTVEAIRKSTPDR